MALAFEAELIFWHGPAPFVFAPLPEAESAAIREAAGELSYGWGCIPVVARVGRTEWKTSLFPKDGRYLMPIKVMVQKAEGLFVGAMIHAELDFPRA